MTDYIIGLDLGTTSTKAAAVTASGEVLVACSSPNHLAHEEPGSATQDPRQVWAGVQSALASLALNADPLKAVGLCISGAMHSLFPAGQDGEPLAPAVTWADLRAGEAAGQLRGRCDAHALYLRTGCPLQYLYHPAKLARMIQAHPDLRLARFAAIKDFVLFNLTGVWATDHGLASSTGLMDTRRLDWDGEALALAGVSAAQLPELVSPLSVVGRLTREVAALTGFPAGLPVVAGAGDGGLANLGSGAVLPGQSVITVGTSGAVRRIANEPRMDDQERTWCYLLFEGRWFHGGASNNAGLAVQWVRERFYPDLPGSAGYEALFADAKNVSAGADGVVVVPYFSGERNPHWDPMARGMIYGLAYEHDRRQVARAVLEGAAFCLADIWNAIGPGVEPVRLTGMINSRPVWAQIVSDVLGLRLAGLEAADASVVGAAMLGHFALGSIPSLEGIAETTHPTARYEPDVEHHAVYERIQRTFRALYQNRPQVS